MGEEFRHRLIQQEQQQQQERLFQQEEEEFFDCAETAPKVYEIKKDTFLFTYLNKSKYSSTTNVENMKIGETIKINEVIQHEKGFAVGVLTEPIPHGKGRKED